MKNAIVQIDATPFRQWYAQHYGEEIGKVENKETEEVKKSRHVLAKLEKRRKTRTVEQAVIDVSNRFKFPCLF